MEQKLQRFQNLLKQLSGDGLAGSIKVLLEQMESESAELLTLCAIPHQFDSDILRALQPTLDTSKAESMFAKFSELSVTVSFNDEIALHDEARAYLFKQWLNGDKVEKFVAASTSLVEYFTNEASVVSDIRLDIAERNRMFHLIGAKQAEGFVEFERIFGLMRYQYRLSDCKTLIDLVHEYDSVLESARTVWLAYHEGKLAADFRQWQHAQELLNAVLSNHGLQPELKLRVFNRLGIINEAQRNWAISIGFFQQALDLARTLEAPGDILYRVLHNLGVVYRDSGDLSKAEKLLNESIELAKENNDLSAQALGYNSSATLNRRLGNPQQAINMYTKSLDYLHQSKERFRPAQVYNNLGMIYADLSEWNKSEEFFRKSLDIKQQAGDTFGQAMTLSNLARVYQNLNLHPKAIEVSNQAIALFEQMKDRYNVAQVKRNLGKLYRRIQQLAIARKYFTEAIDSFNECEELQDAESTRIEMNTLDQKKAVLPWWAWAAVIISLLVVLLIFVLISLGI